MQTEIFTVQGMHNADSVAIIEQTLAAIRGVNKVSVSLAHSSATVEFDPAHALPQQLKAALAVAGFSAAKQGGCCGGCCG